MFRKPKKGKSSLFRQGKNKKRSVDKADDSNDNNDADNISNTNEKRRKKFRKRSSSSDEDEVGGSGGDHIRNDNDSGNGDENTSDLLQQIRNESMKKKGRTKNKSSSDNANDPPSSSSMMHEFKSSKQSMTQQELATSLAQHHPSTNKDNTTTRTTEETDEQNKKAMQKPERNKFLAGPIRASKFIRTTSRFDYEPEICKDYKDTGFCGFGDSCIYLHDRTNMKTGKALEEEWEARKRIEQERKDAEINMFCTIITGENGTSAGGSGADKGNGAASEDDGLPFACHICRGPFEEPVVTQCCHFFCQSCILKRVRDENDQSCPICKKDTNGVFNYPTKLVNKKKRLVGRNGTWQEFADAIKQ